MSKPDSGAMRIIDAPLEVEPEAVWPDAPRHCPGAEFPPYKFVPGRSPHPIRDKKGHSYGKPEPEITPISRDDWQSSHDYLYGIDLYHFGYLWESHEAWEGLWRAAEPDSLESNLLQSLILNSAAQLKAHMGNVRGTRTRSQAARWRLARIRSKGFEGPGSRFLGLNIADLIEQMKRHYGPLWDNPDAKDVRLKGPAPRLVLERDPD